MKEKLSILDKQSNSNEIFLKIQHVAQMTQEQIST